MRSIVRRFILDNFLYGAGESSLADGDSLLDGGIVDSTGVMELIVFLETRFGIHVDDAEVVPDNLDTVDVICRYLAAKGGADLECPMAARG